MPDPEASAATVPCVCIAYEADNDEDDYAPCACGHSIEEHEDGPCAGEVPNDF